MKTNQKFLYVFCVISILFTFITLVYLPIDIIIQFNRSSDGSSSFSKYLVVIVMLILSAFVGFQLYDEKNAHDYTRWYISGLVLTGLEIFIVVINSG